MGWWAYVYACSCLTLLMTDTLYPLRLSHSRLSLVLFVFLAWSCNRLAGTLDMAGSFSRMSSVRFFFCAAQLMALTACFVSFFIPLLHGCSLPQAALTGVIAWHGMIRRRRGVVMVVVSNLHSPLLSLPYPIHIPSHHKAVSGSFSLPTPSILHSSPPSFFFLCSTLLHILELCNLVSLLFFFFYILHPNTTKYFST